MANFDLIEYQKRVIADLADENKALKDKIENHETMLTSNVFCFFSSGFDAAKNGKDLAESYTEYSKWLKPQLEDLEWKGTEKLMENAHIKIQYHNEELTIKEICERLERAENKLNLAISDMKGICYLCGKAKPSRFANATLKTCEHFPGTSSNKRPRCEHFEWRGFKE